MITNYVFKVSCPTLLMTKLTVHSNVFFFFFASEELSCSLTYVIHVKKLLGERKKKKTACANKPQLKIKE